MRTRAVSSDIGVGEPTLSGKGVALRSSCSRPCHAIRARPDVAARSFSSLFSSRFANPAS